MRLVSLWNPREARSQPGSLLWGASGSAPVSRGLITIKGRLEKPSWKSHGLSPGRGGDGGRAESGACCHRNRILSWPVWSQRRNIRWWLQLDTAGGVRWVGKEVWWWGWLTLQDALCILMDGHTCGRTHIQYHSNTSKPPLSLRANVPFYSTVSTVRHSTILHHIGHHNI